MSQLTGGAHPAIPETTDPHPALGPDPVLAAERDHLRHAADCLTRMRTASSAVIDAGVDAWASERLGAARAERLLALAADPGVPAFFGRTDAAPAAPTATGPGTGETFHIGRRHVRDAAGDPVVIDWRAPMSRPFYQASAADPQGVARRRRFGFADGELTSYEDESLGGVQGPGQRPDDGVPSELLRREIERPRSGPMRDIVATIQPDQDDIVRAPLNESICVQGAPGTGKTASGCTGRRTCSTRTRASSAAPACSWSDRTAPSSATSSRCCPPSARSTSSRPPSPS